MLATAIHVCENRGRGGKAAIARIALELSDRAPIYSSGVNWDHWLAFWPEMSHNERRAVMRSEILPAIETIHAPESLPKTKPKIALVPKPEPAEPAEPTPQPRGQSPAVIFSDPKSAAIARRLGLFKSHDPEQN